MSSVSSQPEEVSVQYQPRHTAPKPTGSRIGRAIRALANTATGKEKMVLVFGAITLLSPVDFVPEAIIGPLGLVDDVTALVAVAGTFLEVAKRYAAQQPKSRSRTSLTNNQ